MDVLREIAEQPADFVGWRRHESGVAGPCAADPILAASDLPGLPARAAAPLHQPAMGFVQESHRERQPLRALQLAARVGESVYVVADFLDIVGRCCRSTGLGACLERQQVHERRLRSLDLRRHNGFFANEGIDEPLDRRHHLPGQVEPAELLRCRP